jgi:hypothetical protein
MRCLPVEENPRATLLRLMIRIEPGPLGWLSALAASVMRGDVITERAQRAVERAREALIATSPASPSRQQGRRDRRR